jgi:hypothetical protein
MHSHITNLDTIEQRLQLAGCAYDFRRRAWRCPVCRRPSALRIPAPPDGSKPPRCAWGCAPGRILEDIGASYFDVAPTHFRLGDRP